MSVNSFLKISLYPLSKVGNPVTCHMFFQIGVQYTLKQAANLFIISSC